MQSWRAARRSTPRTRLPHRDEQARALERTIEKGVASRERVLAQWARIAFFDLRKAVAWSGGTVSLFDSEEPDDDSALAISEVMSSNDGGPTGAPSSSTPVAAMAPMR
jgi:hypothetical protein